MPRVSNNSREVKRVLMKLEHSFEMQEGFRQLCSDIDCVPCTNTIVKDIKLIGRRCMTSWPNVVETRGCNKFISLRKVTICYTFFHRRFATVRMRVRGFNSDVEEPAVTLLRVGRGGSRYGRVLARAAKTYMVMMMMAKEWSIAV